MKSPFRRTVLNHFSPRLKTQLIVSFVGTTCVGLLIFTAFSYISIVQVVRNQLYQTNVQQIRQLEFNISTFQMQIDKITRLLIVSMGPQSSGDLGGGADVATMERMKSIYEAFSEMLNNYEYIDSIYYYRKDGTTIGVNPRENIYFPAGSAAPIFFRDAVVPLESSVQGNIHWFGGYLSTDFLQPGDTNPTSSAAVHYISAVRSVNYLGGERAFIVINVYERDFAAIYADGTDDGSKGSKYIMLGDGKIISGTDDLSIGQTTSVSRKIASRGDLQGTMEALVGGLTYQCVYQHFPALDWIMVSKIPQSLSMQDILKVRDLLVAFFILSLGVAFGISMYWIYRITRPLDELRIAMGEMEQGQLGSTLPESSGSELGALGRQFNRMSLSIASLIQRVHVVEAEKRDLEIESLQWQINPHFLYNTLSTIRHMALTMHANNVAESISALGSILEPLYRRQGVLCSVLDELDYVTHYIRIMNYRFGEGIELRAKVPEYLKRYSTLPFILQPIIENSIQHGIAANEGKGVVSISIGRRADALSIEVADDGVGMSATRLTEVKRSLSPTESELCRPSGGIGLANVHRRIQLHFGRDYGLRIASRSGAGTKVSIRLPIVQNS